MKVVYQLVLKTRRRRLVPGQCIGCGCTDDYGCPEGCGWADVDHTICTVCVTGQAAGRGGREAGAAMTPRAAYHYTTHGSVICIVDEGAGKSVTNDVENVLEDLRREGINLARVRLIYRDSQGLWDEIVVLDDRFRRFRAIGARTLEAALDQIRRLKRDKLNLCTQCGERERPKPQTRAQLLAQIVEAVELLDKAAAPTAEGPPPDPPAGFDSDVGYRAHCLDYARAILREVVDLEVTGRCETCAGRAPEGVVCPNCDADALAEAAGDR
jgi:hypothetical protein